MLIAFMLIPAVEFVIGYDAFGEHEEIFEGIFAVVGFDDAINGISHRGVKGSPYSGLSPSGIGQLGFEHSDVFLQDFHVAFVFVGKVGAHACDGRIEIADLPCFQFIFDEHLGHLVRFGDDFGGRHSGDVIHVIGRYFFVNEWCRARS